MDREVAMAPLFFPSGLVRCASIWANIGRSLATGKGIFLSWPIRPTPTGPIRAIAMPVTIPSEALKRQLLDIAARGVEPTMRGLETRPAIMLAPQSFVGNMHAAAVAARLPNLVAVVDDRATEATLWGVPRWSSAEFLIQAGKFADALAIDFSTGMEARALFSSLCAHVRVERQDCVAVLAQLDMWSVYEPVRQYRSRTLERLDDFIRLADRFQDEHSRATLYGNLLFRLSYERSHMLPSWASPIDEYFSLYASPSTFNLGSREHYCDCGAFQGPIVSKFLAATGRQYGSITAFEPDRSNFDVLTRISPIALDNYRPVNKAVSNRTEELRFHETGTVSSHVSDTGTVTVQTARLDDELDKLTFLKMDVEGYEARTLEGAAGLIGRQRPRIAACVYHYAQDLLDVVAQLDKSAGDYHLRLRQHNASYFYDLVLYASPVAGSGAPAWAA
jgi:FkbM family methyltransferase